MLGDGVDHLVAVVALGDDLEAVVGAEDAGHAGPHDRLVVDDEDADHAAHGGRRGRVGRAGGAASHLPAVRRRPGLELAAEGARPLPHPDEAEVPGASRRRGPPGGRGRPRARWTCPSAASSAHLDAVAGGVPGHVGQRLACDAVQGRADRALDGRRRPARRGPSTSSPARRYSSRSAARSAEPASGGIGAPLVGPQRRHGGTDLIEAGPTDRLGVDECTLGLVDVASQHVSGAGDVEEHSGERVPGQVVQLAGDASALFGHGLLGRARGGRPRAAR